MGRRLEVGPRGKLAVPASNHEVQEGQSDSASTARIAAYLRPNNDAEPKLDWQDVSGTGLTSGARARTQATRTSNGMRVGRPNKCRPPQPIRNVQVPDAAPLSSARGRPERGKSREVLLATGVSGGGS